MSKFSQSSALSIVFLLLLLLGVQESNAAPAASDRPESVAKQAAPSSSPPKENRIRLETPLPEQRNEPALPIRSARNWSISGELGWNGLSGLGVNLAYHPMPQLALELGGGISLGGLKTGLRARFNLLESAWTPIFGAGFLMESGTGGSEEKFETDDGEAVLVLRSSPYAQLVTGLNYTGDSGFMFMFTTGYAILLRKENVTQISGSEKVADTIRGILGSGLVLSTSFGYAF